MGSPGDREEEGATRRSSKESRAQESPRGIQPPGIVPDADSHHLASTTTDLNRLDSTQTDRIARRTSERYAVPEQKKFTALSKVDIKQKIEKARTSLVLEKASRPRSCREKACSLLRSVGNV